MECVTNCSFGIFVNQFKSHLKLTSQVCRICVDLQVSFGRWNPSQSNNNLINDTFHVLINGSLLELHESKKTSLINTVERERFKLSLVYLPASSHMNHAFVWIWLKNFWSWENSYLNCNISLQLSWCLFFNGETHYRMQQWAEVSVQTLIEFLRVLRRRIPGRHLPPLGLIWD